MTAIAEPLMWYAQARQRAFVWRQDLPWTAKAALALLMAGLTGLLAQARVPLPFTPVPLTGQVFAVLVAGVLLGGRFAALSQFLYVGLGAAGLGWFAGLSGGFAILCGPTGGYLLGFLPAAWLVGSVTERFPSMRRPLPLFGLMAAAVGLIHLAGAPQFALFMGAGLKATLAGAVLPFIAGDLAKAMAAAVVGTTLLPRN